VIGDWLTIPVKADLNVRPDTDQPRRRADGELSEGRAMQRFSSQAVLTRYRLIDSGCEPHRQLDGQYTSLDEAIADAIEWVEPLADSHHHAAQLIGVDVGTGDGNWRTCRLPAPLLCQLPG
jgi:hypothetical protein